MKCSETSSKDISIPQFPHSQPLGFEHKEFLDLIFEKYPSLISEYSFAGIITFSETYNYKITCANNVPIIMGCENEQVFALMPQELCSQNVFIDLLEKQYVIKAIPHSCKKSVQKLLNTTKAITGATLTYNEGDWDYLHKRHKLAQLSGRKFHKKRNHVNYFIEHYSYSTQLLNSKTIDAAYTILEDWKEHHGSIGDYEGVLQALKNYSRLPYVGEITFVDAKPVGFIIAEMRNKNRWCIIHFEKANIEYKGLFQFVNWHFARSLSDSCKVINREQDLNQEGLRQAKQTYRPDLLLRKYRLYPRGVPIPLHNIHLHEYKVE